MHKELGKIESVHFGYGGYQDCQIVFELRLKVRTLNSHKVFECGWGHLTREDLVKAGSNYKWTHDDRIKQIGNATWEVFTLMKAAKVKSFDELVGVPIEATFDSPCGRLLSVRPLEEVL